MLVSDLLQKLEILWPSESADDWDRPGLSVGSSSVEITKVLLSVDVTKGVVEEAIALGCNLIVSHHPLLLRGVNQVSSESLKGPILELAIKNDVVIFSAHTNADKAEIGTAMALARLFGLSVKTRLNPISGHGVIGELPSPMKLIEFSTKVARVLPAVAAGVKVAGNPEQLVQRIAIAPGAGDSETGQALAASVDVFITSDLRHHPSQDFMETPSSRPKALIDVSHWASEYSLLPEAKLAIERFFPGLEVLISELKTDPWDFAVMQ